MHVRPRLLPELGGQTNRRRKAMLLQHACQDEFSAPDFTGPLDLPAHLAATPVDESCKGFFFTGVVDLVRKLRPGRDDELLDGVVGRRWVAFRDYPLRDNLRLLSNAVGILYPRLAGRDAMRRMGWLAHPFFAESIVGKVVYGLLGSDPDALIASGPRAYELSLRYGRMYVQRCGPRHWRARLEHVAFFDTYHVGVVEGALRMRAVVPRVLLRIESRTCGELDITWV
jgi:uncharacterized protein (TIGR02265 family)